MLDACLLAGLARKASALWASINVPHRITNQRKSNRIQGVYGFTAIIQALRRKNGTSCRRSVPPEFTTSHHVANVRLNAAFARAPSHVKRCAHCIQDRAARVGEKTFVPSDRITDTLLGLLPRLQHAATVDRRKRARAAQLNARYL